MRVRVQTKLYFKWIAPVFTTPNLANSTVYSRPLPMPDIDRILNFDLEFVENEPIGNLMVGINEKLKKIQDEHSTHRMTVLQLDVKLPGIK
jgi:hypothetical protein